RADCEAGESESDAFEAVHADSVVQVWLQLRYLLEVRQLPGSIKVRFGRVVEAEVREPILARRLHLQLNLSLSSAARAAGSGRAGHVRPTPRSAGGHEIRRRFRCGATPDASDS